MALNLPEPILTAELFPEMLAELLGLLRSLTDEEWQKPTACSGWSVKDVALHLLGVEIGNLSRRRDGHRLEVEIHSQAELLDFINQSNQQWVEVGRRISPRLLIDLLERTGFQMIEYFCGLDPYALGSPVSWVGPRPAKVWVDVAREYTERWHHQQHIRDALGKPGLKEPRFFAPVLRAFMLAMPLTYRDMFMPDGTAVGVTITGQAGGEWSLTSLGGAWRLYSGRIENADARVTLADDLAWRLFTRGMDPALAKEQMKFAGDPSLGEKLLEMTAIIA